MNTLVPLAVAVPFLAAPLLAAASHLLPRNVVELAAIVTAAATAVLTGVLLIHTFTRPEVYWFGGWEPRGNVALGISFVVDPLGAGIAFLGATLFVAALVFGWHYFDEAGALAHVLLLLFLGSVVGFSYSGDLFNIFVFLELLTTAAVALTAYRADERQSLQGAFNFGIVNTLGAVSILFGIGLLYGRTGALNLAQVGRALEGSKPDGLLVVAFTLLTVGFLIKAGAVPFHFWLSDAYAVAPATVCALFAGVMTELGLLGFARVYWTVFAPVPLASGSVRDVLLGVGALTAVLGAVMAFLQRHLKRLLAYSSIAYTGVFLIGIALLTPEALAGSALYVLGHGFAKAALFLCAGILFAQTDVADELLLRGRGASYRLTAVTWFAAAVALTGPPFLGAFLGRGMLDDAAVAGGYDWVPPLLACVAAISSGALFRAGARVFFGAGPARDPLLTPEPTEGPEDRTGSERALVVAPAVLAVAALAVGAVPGLATHALQGAKLFADPATYAALTLDGRVPALPHAFHETSTASVAWSLVSLAGAAAVAAFALYRERLPRGWRDRAWRWSAPALDAVRAAHSGHVADYVAWLTLGAAVLGGLFAIRLA
jgi:multicomponent Na+:H+ antiporter subunit D